MNDIMKQTEYWAEIAQKSGLFPKKINIFQIKAIIEIGREIGLSPFFALKHINFIQGTINFDVQAQLALFKRAGGKITKMESTAERAYVELEYRGMIYTSEFTIKDAEAMELTNRRNKDGEVYKGSYEKYPAIMLLWRAIGNRLKFIIPEITAGLYSRDEIATFIDLPPDENPQEPPEAADDFIINELAKDTDVAAKLKELSYSRRQAINIYKDFNGNLDKICEILDNELKQQKQKTEQAQIETEKYIESCEKFADEVDKIK